MKSLPPVVACEGLSHLRVLHHHISSCPQWTYLRVECSNRFFMLFFFHSIPQHSQTFAAPVPTCLQWFAGNIFIKKDIFPKVHEGDEIQHEIYFHLVSSSCSLSCKVWIRVAFLLSSYWRVIYSISVGIVCTFCFIGLPAVLLCFNDGCAM